MESFARCSVMSSALRSLSLSLLYWEDDFQLKALQRQWKLSYWPAFDCTPRPALEPDTWREVLPKGITTVGIQIGHSGGFLHLLHLTSLFMPRTRPPPLQCTFIFFVFSLSVSPIFVFNEVLLIFLYEKYQRFLLAYWKGPIYCDTVISQVAFPACFQSEGGEIW